MQPSDMAKQYDYCMKWTYHVSYPQAIKKVGTNAWKDTMAYPGGPVGIEFPMWTLGTDIKRSWPTMPSLPERHNVYVENWRKERTGERFPPGGGNQAAVERTVRRIMSAKKPLMMGGDGINYSEAEKEFVEFAELAGLPACGRRSGRGCIPETHPQNVRLEPYVLESDLPILIGCKLGLFDGGFCYGWPAAIQINEAPQHIWHFLESEEVIVGNPKEVLRQMIDVIKRDNLKPNPEAQQWLGHVQEKERAGWERLMQKAER